MPANGDEAGVRNGVRIAGLPIVPDEDRTVVIVPQNIGAAISIEIAGTCIVPSRWNTRGRGHGVCRAGVSIVPDEDRAVIVAPQYVASAIAIEVCRVCYM